MSENWRQCVNFQTYLELCSHISDQTNRNSCSNVVPSIFFKYALQSFEKNLLHWTREYKVMMLGSEYETAKICAKWIMNKEHTICENRFWYSPKHNTDIDMSALIRFMNFDKLYDNLDPYVASIFIDHYHDTN